MEKDKIKEILYIILAIILAVIAVKVALWLLPIILIAVVSYLIYININKDNQRGRSKNKKRLIKIIHDDEKDNK